jgi:hypothetical protein
MVTGFFPFKSEIAVSQFWRIFAPAVIFGWMLGGQPANAVPTISAVSVAHDETDYSSRLKIGGSGFWFANFNAGAPVVGAPVDQDAANSLPKWIVVNFNPESDSNISDYSFSLTPGEAGPNAASTGGQPDYNRLTLSDGSSGVSGQLVDLGVGVNHTSTLIKTWKFGPGAPTAALIHIVLDNAPRTAGTVVDRLRVTHRNASTQIKARAMFDKLAAGSNGIADVYTFRLEGMEVNGSFAVQLSTANDDMGASTGLAGIAFDALQFPESTSSWLTLTLAAGAIGIVVALALASIVLHRRQLLATRRQLP